MNESTMIKGVILAMFFAILLGMMPTNGDARDNYPPRTIQLCNDGYIGHGYNPKLEKRCRVLWNEWTKEINKSYNQ